MTERYIPKPGHSQASIPIVISKTMPIQLAIMTREDAVRDGLLDVWLKLAIPVPEGQVRNLVNARAAEHRALQLLAVWMKKRRPREFNQLEMQTYLDDA